MPKTFPLPFNIGTDICHVGRIQKLLSRSSPHHSQKTPLRFLRKVLTQYEIKEKPQIDYFLKLQPTDKYYNATLHELSLWVAGRWAAKEAIIKAYRGRRILMSDIRIGVESQLIKEMKASSGGPNSGSLPPRAFVKVADEEARLAKEAKLGGEVKELLEEDHWEDAREVKISISHDGEYATAVCLAIEEEAFDEEFRKAEKEKRIARLDT